MRSPSPYAPPSFDADIDLDLSRNEGLPPPASLLEGIPDPGALIGRYPDTTELRRAIASAHEIDPGRVLVTAGGDDALFRSVLALVPEGGEALATTPSFEMIPRYVDQAGGTLVEVPWWDGEFPIDRAENSTTADTAAAFVVSPNNPTGAVMGSEALHRLAASTPVVVLDSAYAEFAEDDLTPVALELGNVVVIRTLSKAWGLAGLRVGYLLGPSGLVARIGAYGNPYPVSGLSQALALRRLTASSEMTGFVAEVRRQRDELTAFLRSRGIDALDSHANFVLASFDSPEWVRSAAASLGVGLRTFPDRAGLEAGVRITLPGERVGFERLLRVLDSIIAPGALLFDLDGVLADTGRSQTAAIVETAVGLGATITRHDVEMARAAGNANDDWELTWRLCRDSGAHVSIEEVTERFESIYQGSDDEPGLKLRETALVDLSLLSEWAGRLPIGVVTGRPRKDAEEFLHRSGLSDCVSTVVTREDAPLKPSPEPVLMAMERLGVATAWMLGDTPDDIVAAKGAGVVPIGVIAPGTDPETSRTALAGAARILESTTQLRELLT